MSLRIVPESSHAKTTAQGQFLGAPSAPGVHDTLRSNLNLVAPASTSTSSGITQPQLQSSHPLEARIQQWRSTQDNLKMSLLARQFGVGEPVRRGMEMMIAQQGEWRPQIMGGGQQGVAADILGGRDCEIGWEDVFVGNELREVPDFHTEMEARMRMNW